MGWLIIVFAIIQGLAEFLPISSSAHLLFVQEIVNNEDSFEILILLNFGSIGALCFFSRRILGQLFQNIRKFKFQLFIKLLLSCLPVALAGFLLASLVEDLRTNLILISWMLITVGVVMIIKPPQRQTTLTWDNLSWSKVGIIAGAQVLALIPGVSRLGITALAGLWQGFDRRLAIEWSFLLAIPLLLGVSIKTLLTDTSFIFVEENLIGVLGANMITFLLGLVFIQIAYKLMVDYGLTPFGIYRIVLGTAIISLLALNVL